MKAGGGRQKGAQFERDIAKALDEALGIKFHRNLRQYQKAGLDDLTREDGKAFPFMLELKRYGQGTSSQPVWWDQICAAARSADNEHDSYPALIYKYDRQQIRCRVPLQAVADLAQFGTQEGEDKYDWRYAVEMDWDTFMMVCRELLADAS
jgi:hypothetical protein